MPDIRKDWKIVPPKQEVRSLDDAVSDWLWRKDARRVEISRDWVIPFCEEARSLPEAINRACMSLGEHGKMYHHQTRVPKAILKKLARELIGAQRRIRRCKVFDDLFDLVSELKPKGIGPVTEYDVAVRVGAYLGLYPDEYLYLHAGVLEGAKTLKLDTRGKRRLHRSELPEPLLRLETDDIEDFLCGYRMALEDLAKEKKLSEQAELLDLPMVRTSERSCYTWCRQRWEWAYVENWAAKREHTRVPLRFGDLVHKALEGWYIPGRERGEHPAITFKKLYDESGEQYGMRGSDDDKWVKAEELGPAILNHYVDTYGEEEHIEIIAPEMPGKVLLLSKQGKPMAWYVFRLDAVYRDLTKKRNSVGLLEHKTAGSISTTHLQLDEQAGSYWAFGPQFLKENGYLEADETIDHILYNFLRKSAPDQRPRNAKGHYLNKDGSVSKKQPAPYFRRVPVYRDEADRENLITRARMQVWEMNLVREGKLPVYKAPTNFCIQRCQFYDVCELHETGSDWEETLRLNYEKRDPYQDYEEDLFEDDDDEF